MNANTESAECYHNMHSQCTFEDCACICHEPELLEDLDSIGDFESAD